MNADEAQVAKMAERNLDAFRQIYMKWLTPIYRYFYYRVGNVKEAEDLTSQVFLKVFEELPRYRERGLFAAWLFTIARNKANDFFRQRLGKFLWKALIRLINPLTCSPKLSIRMKFNG